MSQSNQPTQPPTQVRYSDTIKNKIINDIDEYFEVMGIEDPVKEISYLFNEFVFKGDFIEMAAEEPQKVKNITNTVTYTIAFLSGLYEKMKHYNDYSKMEKKYSESTNT